MPREVTYTANRCGSFSRICSVTLAYASDHVTTRKPFSPFRRIIGSERRPRALRSFELILESDGTSPRRSGSSAGAVFKRISSRRTMQRWTPSWVQSLRPAVPNAHPSQTPCFRIRQAKGSWSRFSQTTRSISAYWFGLRSVGSRGITEAQSDGFHPIPQALSSLRQFCFVPSGPKCKRLISRQCERFNRGWHDCYPTSVRLQLSYPGVDSLDRCHVANGHKGLRCSWMCIRRRRTSSKPTRTISSLSATFP